MSIEPLHRDDLDPDLLAQIGEMFPGFKIACVGDAPEGSLPAEVVAAMKEIERIHRASIVFGTCLDCGAQMPNYPPPEGEMPDDWTPAKGWRWFENNGNICAWQCPECDAKEQ